METGDILAAFDDIARCRGWQSLHTPKNLAMALSVEVAELCRHLQWKSDAEIHELMQSVESRQVAAELADIQMYLCKLAATLGVDMDSALSDKIEENRRRHVQQGRDL
ncbi:MazG nucleotide pyrophosphohydrolase domain [Microbulbifer donghaiensis]|uniref:MazG nucleotide pyrophosphohydrolase domain n=1 Tax=Microbulbifer donghaiensis TaxID=494016 RepID=A0A1M4VL90_9GAMM|nr:nucleotide pyrophosphohydrolase [Microbulbifer donghaiensis]SHE69630.1 MazG nucleotide pyrophosphohydrolase domain [Microbulbifer donghaiensis]